MRSRSCQPQKSARFGQPKSALVFLLLSVKSIGGVASLATQNATVSKYNSTDPIKDRATTCYCAGGYPLPGPTDCANYDLLCSTHGGTDCVPGCECCVPTISPTAAPTFNCYCPPVPTPRPTGAPTWWSKPHYVKHVQAKSQLNGANGEVTGKDDVDNRKTKGKAGKKKKGTPSQQRVKRAVIVAKRRGGLLLRECTAKYAMAVSNPFNPHAMGACVPKWPGFNSQKSCGRFEVTATVGTSGYGFVCMSPCSAGDGVTVWYSNATYAGNNLWANGATAGVETGVNNLPYTKSQLLDVASTTNIQSRIVGAGLQISYTGTVLNKGGTYYALTQPNHNSVHGYTASTMSACPGYYVAEVEKGPLTLCSSAVMDEETQYRGSAYTSSSASSNNTINWIWNYSGATPSPDYASTGAGAPMMGILFTGTPGNTFRVVSITHVEYIGNPTRQQQTPTDTDPQGFEKVNAAAQEIALDAKGNAMNAGPSLYTRLVNTLRDVSAHDVRNMVDAAKWATGQFVYKGRSVPESWEMIT